MRIEDALTFAGNRITCLHLNGFYPTHHEAVTRDEKNADDATART